MSHELPTASSEPDFKLGSWWVRPQRNEIDGDDDSVHLEARSMNVLVCLARHAPDVVSKQRLRDTVWADAPYVGDDVIAHAIWELRKAFGDSAKNPAVIQTIPRRGYRLLPEINRPSGSPVPVEGASIDHYLLGRELGRGSMGVVYEAVDRRLGRTVAVKFLAPELTRDPKSVQRFVREARLAASLEHPNLATVYEVGETSRGHRYLVMAHYAGGSLKDRLIRGPVPVDEAVRLARQLCAGLAAAHARDIIHRDIKPANLLLDEHGTLKIADFGIAKLLGGSDLTRTGAALGTPAYKSPEQSRGEPVDMRTDIWSVGVVLFEMLTGRRPFDGDYEHAVVHAILSRRPRLAEDAFGQPVSKPLRQVVAQALAKEPTARFESAEALRAALEGFASGTASVPLVQRATMMRWIAITVATSLMLSAVMIWFGDRDLPQVDDPATEFDRTNEAVAADGALSAGTSPSPVAIDRQARHHLRMGQRAWMSGNSVEHLAEAEREFADALEIEPSWPKAVGLMALFLADLYELERDERDLEEATDLVDWARELSLADPLLSVAEARLLLLDHRKESLERAEQILAAARVQQSLPCGPGESCDLVFVWLADAQWRQDRDTAAVETLEACRHAGGGGATRCRLKEAQFHEKHGEYLEAEILYKEVLEHESRQTTALNELGALYLRKDQYLKALGQFKVLIEETSHPSARVNYGQAFYGLGRFDQALEQFELADRGYESLGSIVPTPRVNRGDVHRERGEDLAARRFYEEALALFDRLLANTGALPYREAQRAVCLAKLGRLDEAVAEIERLRNAQPESLDLMVYEARIHALNRDREKLFAVAEMAIDSGIALSRLTSDAAFIAYRNDDQYLLLIAEHSGDRQ